MPMPELEGIEGWSRGTRRRLGLLDGLGPVSWALLVVAMSGMSSSWLSTTSLTITLLLFEGWLIGAAFDRTELVGITRGSLLTLPLFPDQGHSSPDLGEVQVGDFLLLAHDLSDAIHGWRELRHDDHGLEMFGDIETRSYYTCQVGNRLVDAEGGVLMVRHSSLNRSLELEIGGDDSRFSIQTLQGSPEETGVLHQWTSVIPLDS